MSYLARRALTQLSPTSFWDVPAAGRISKAGPETVEIAYPGPRQVAVTFHLVAG